MKNALCLLILCSLLTLSRGLASARGEQNFVLDKFLKESVGLDDAQIATVHHGKPIATVLDSPTPDQVFVFGTIHIDAAPEQYLQLATDFNSLRKMPGYLAIQRFSDPPQLSDLRDFTIEPEDFKELKNCKAGDCEVQLPSEAMEQFQKSVNWSAADASSQANRLAQQMALQA